MSLAFVFTCSINLLFVKRKLDHAILNMKNTSCGLEKITVKQYVRFIARFLGVRDTNGHLAGGRRQFKPMLDFHT